MDKILNNGLYKNIYVCVKVEHYRFVFHVLVLARLESSKLLSKFDYNSYDIMTSQECNEIL